MGCGAWGVWAQIEKATLPAPVTQAPLDTTELPMRVRTVGDATPGILTVRPGSPIEIPAAPTEKDAVWTRVCGSVLYADNWTETDPKYGVYSAPLNGAEFTPLCVDNKLYANGGGFFKDNYYYCCNYMVSNGIGYYHNVRFSTSTWTQSAYATSNSTTYASDFAPDPVTGKVYASARNNNPNQ